MAKRAPRIGTLDSIEDIEVELRKVYRAARSGKMETQDATRLTSILHTMVNIRRDTELEKRISELEKQNANN